MVEIVIGTVWFVGVVVVGYGVFAAPSASVDNWYQRDRPYFKIRLVGGALVLLAMVIAAANYFLG